MAELRASWGISDTSSPVTGVVSSKSLRVDGVFQEDIDADGAKDAVYLFDEVKSLSFDVLVKATEHAPDIGTPIRVERFSGWVKSSEESETNQSYRKIHIEAESSKNVTSASKIEGRPNDGYDAIQLGDKPSGLGWDGPKL